jgi:phosphoribosylaminoimidazole-succinocarboxamide synthase
MNQLPLESAVSLIQAPLLYKGKVRELYDLQDSLLIVVTDRISAFDYMLQPSVPSKGIVLNSLSKFWFEKTSRIIDNHVIHTDIERLHAVIPDASARELLRDRIMVTRRAERIPIECVVRGYITGGGWRQYQQSLAINGITLPSGMRKNEKFTQPIFTPAAKNDIGHDEDISIEQMKHIIGHELTETLVSKSIELYSWAHEYCLARGIIIADTKFEFGIVDGKLILIDEIFTPDSSRYWLRSKYAWDIEIDSMDKEPVRTYLSQSTWDKVSEPDPLPAYVVAETVARYQDIQTRLLKS